MQDRAPPDRILVARTPGETRWALLAGDELIEIIHARDGTLQPGTVHFGRIGAAVPHMPAVFVNLGRTLPGVMKTKQPFSEGQGCPVEVIVPERPGKGAELALASQISSSIGSAVGEVLRLAPDPAAAWWPHYRTSIEEIVANTQAEAMRLKASLGPDAPIAVYRGAGDPFAAVDEAIEIALSPRVVLPCGGSAIIETTAAVVAVDVNAGPADPDTANGEALVAVAHALRQRNLAGHIVIDTIPTRRKAALPRMLAKLTADDPRSPRIAGLTPLGMIELTRQRRGLTLAETLCDPDGRLSVETIALKALRDAVRFGFTERATKVTIVCASEIADVLAGALGAARREAEEMLKCPITVRAESGSPRERVDLRP